MSIKREIAIFLAIFALAAGLRLYHLGHYSLWMDEVYQVRLQNGATSLSQIIDYASRQNQPPLDYIIGYVVAKFFAFSETIARGPAFLFGTCSIIASYTLARRLFNQGTAIVSSLMMAFSVSLIYFSQEARPYSIFLFFQLLVLNVFYRNLESNEIKLWKWIFFTSIITLTLLTRGMAPVTFLLALIVSFSLAMLIFYLDFRRFIFPFTFNTLRNLIFSSLCAGLLFLPFFIKVWGQSHTYVKNNPIKDIISFPIIEPALLLFSHSLPYNMGKLWYFCLFGMVIGIFYIVRKRSAKKIQFVFLLYAFLEPLISVYLFYVVVGTFMNPKPSYFVQSIIPIFIICSYGYVSILNDFSKNLGKNCQFILYFFMLLVIAVVSVVQLPSYYAKPKGFAQTDYRGAIQYLKTVYNENDVAVYDTFRQYGVWEPNLYGHGVYYNDDQMALRQYNWNNFISFLEKGFTTEGKLFLFLWVNKDDGTKFFNSDELVEKSFEQMTVVYIQNKSLSIKEQTLLFIDEMLKFFPEDSSRVDLYLAKAKILCQESKSEATKNVLLANKLLKGKSVEYRCD